jgi:uncharacterized protein (TIGR02594 family)
MSFFGVFFRKNRKTPSLVSTVPPPPKVTPPVPEVKPPRPPEELAPFYPAWLQIAVEELGTREIAGDEHNPRIVQYHQATTLKATTDEVPWCASFVNWCLQEGGSIGSRSAAARSFQTWGLPVKISVNPRLGMGSIIVLRRGSNPRQGHVGFYVGRLPGYVLVLGGNQSNRVQVDAYPFGQILGCRWPVDVEYPT